MFVKKLPVGYTQQLLLSNIILYNIDTSWELSGIQ